MFCIIGLCAAATAQTKAKPTSKPKDNKEKRDAAVTGPYSYEAPQKSFQIPIHAQPQQQKAAAIEYHHSAPKGASVEYHHSAPKAASVAPISYYQQKQAAPIHVQPQQYQEVPQYPTSFGYPTAVESLFGQQHQQPSKDFSEYSFSYPSLESFSHMPIVHYNQELNKINSAYLDFPDFKTPSFSGYKAEQYQPSFSYGSPAPAYSFPSHSYAAPTQHSYAAPTQQSYAPQQQIQQHSYIASPSYHPAPPPQSQPQYGFSQSPSAIFVPQTISISPKPTKTPDYASGSKGLGHFSTISAGPTEQAYYKQQYEVPQYYQLTQTERPFKASHYIGSQHVDSHSEQSIASGKPSGEYLPPSKQYLPAKEQYMPAKSVYAPAREYQHYMPENSPVEYQIRYVTAPSPSKAYIPPVANNYLPPKAAPEPPKSTYLPASPPKSSYLPPSPPKNSYLPPAQPTNNYLPPNNPYHSAPSQQFQQYQQQDSYESVDYQSGHK